MNNCLNLSFGKAFFIVVRKMARNGPRRARNGPKTTTVLGHSFQIRVQIKYGKGNFKSCGPLFCELLFCLLNMKRIFLKEHKLCPSSPLSGTAWLYAKTFLYVFKAEKALVPMYCNVTMFLDNMYYVVLEAFILYEIVYLFQFQIFIYSYFS